MKRLALVLLLVAMLVTPVFAQGDDVKAFLKSWAERMRDVKTLRVEFTQTKALRILRKPLVSKGVVRLKGKKLLMLVDLEDGSRDTELAVDAEKGEARLHYPRLRRLEVFEIGKGADPATPFPLFGGDVESLPTTHKVALEGDTLVLVPPSGGETRMTFADGQVKRVVQTTAGGDKLTVDVSRFDVNAEVKDDEVELRVPEGTEVVHPLAGKK